MESASRLFSIFFKTYTEKVWGISLKELSADWAAQRIKGLDLGQAIKSALLPKRKSPKRRGAVITTLIDEFRYPRLGPGQMWERVSQTLAAQGYPVLLDQEVVSVRHAGGRVHSVVVRSGSTGETEELEGDDFSWTLRVVELIQKWDTALAPHET